MRGFALWGLGDDHRSLMALYCAIELQEAKTEELDVEALLQFAQGVLQNADRLWVESPLVLPRTGRR